MRPTMETKALDDLFSGLWSLCEIGVIFSKRVLTTLQTRLSKQKPWIRSALTFLATDWEAIDENGIVIVTMHHNTKEQSTRTMAIAIEWSRFIDSVWPGHLINMRAFDLSRTKEIKNISPDFSARPLQDGESFKCYRSDELCRRSMFLRLKVVIFPGSTEPMLLSISSASLIKTSRINWNKEIWWLGKAKTHVNSLLAWKMHGTKPRLLLVAIRRGIQHTFGFVESQDNFVCSRVCSLFSSYMRATNVEVNETMSRERACICKLDIVFCLTMWIFGENSVNREIC